jgi:hypothetical protein
VNHRGGVVGTRANDLAAKTRVRDLKSWEPPRVDDEACTAGTPVVDVVREALDRLSQPPVARISSVGRQRIEGQLAVVSLAQQYAECAVALAPVARRIGKPPPQDHERPLEFRFLETLAGGERPLDQLAIDAALSQGAPDPLVPPLRESALVLDDQPREPSIVEHTLIAEHGQGCVDGPLSDAALLKPTPDLSYSALARVQVCIGELQRTPGLLVGVGNRASGVGHGPTVRDVDPYAA